jgi:carnitine O-acetyltransferase
MLRFQASLPHLPVPTLSSTASKYLESVRPHLSDAAFAKTQSAVNAFLVSAQAAELQARLQDRAAKPGMKSWLADWWNVYAYTAYRDPVVVFVSYFFVHLDDKRRRDPAKRASALVKALMSFRDITER